MTRVPIPRLGPEPDAPFPPANQALAEPNGLLAFGGDLDPRRLLAAYDQGVFPWYGVGQPLLWWSPDPRPVFRTDGVRLSSRFRRTLRRSSWVLRADTAFDRVVAACASVPRPGQDGTWIVPEMARAYAGLHRLGHAHSIEVFDGDALVGGIYGVARGRMFFGESMFSARSGGSKVALAGLGAFLHGAGWPWIDAQVGNPHLASMGAELVPRPRFLATIAGLVALPGLPGPWTHAFGTRRASALA
jgi:leucyl/phenylalanyl-tRNA---protein transferase